MLGLLFSVLNVIPGLAERFLDWQIKKANVELEGFRVGAMVDTQAYQAWLNATVETNRVKAAANTWWGAKLIIFTAGWPCAMHLAAIMLDSLPFWIPLFMNGAHVVGSWGVPKPPAPYDAYQQNIVLSFFIITPALPVISAVSQWLGRKR